jgi:hypothetical protein
MSNGAFRKKKTYFTQVSNHALRDKTLSLKAKGLYSLIQSYLTIEDFTLYKATLRKQCCEGEKSFEKTWKELKEAGYLIQHKLKKTNGAFYYEYELLEEKTQTPEKEGVDSLGGGKVPLYNNTEINNTEIKNIQSVSQSLKNTTPDGQTDEQSQSEIETIIENARVETYDSEDLRETLKEVIKQAYNDKSTRPTITRLKLEHIDIAKAIYIEQQNQQEIKKPVEYFKKCLISAIQESGLKGLF